MSTDRDIKVQIMTLREFESSKGRRYLRGFLGDAAVVCFQDEQAEPQYGEISTWVCYVTPKKPKAKGKSGGNR